MDKKIRVAAVSYLNTKPLIWGFEQGRLKDDIELIFDYPAKVAAMLLNDEADIGLVPVAMIPRMNEHHIISDYCIGAVEAVASVCLFSNVPLPEITHILLDYQSRTSAALLKILLKEHWHIDPVLTNTTEGYQELITGTTAGLVIGDRALKQRKSSLYIYDLAEAWQQMTGLPFVFAAWVANKQLPASFISDFNKATGEGFNHLQEIVAAHSFPDYDLHTYYSKNIDYRLDDQKRKAMALFLEKIDKT